MKKITTIILLQFLIIVCNAQNKIDIEYTTGEDDLRASPGVLPPRFIVYYGEQGDESHYLDVNFANAPAHSVRIATRLLPSYVTLDNLKNKPIRIIREKSSRIVTNGDRIKAELNADNWDLQKLVVTATIKENGVTKKYLLFSQEGNPIHRFVFTQTGNGNWKDFRLKAQPELISGGVTATSQAARVSKFIITLGTGGDDLRGGGDNATIILKLRTPDNMMRNITLTNVNRNRKIDNFRTYTTERNLLPEEMDIDANQIYAVGIKHDGGSGMGADNWDLDRFKITIVHRGQQKVLVDTANTPLHRFTGDSRYKEFNVE